jgi:ubiquinone/menaquinone biosynthesis C-methylase UbiE
LGAVLKAEAVADHLDRTRAEFTRQAAHFAAAAAVNEERQIKCFTDEAAPMKGGVVLDVACGPGIVTAALAPLARAVVAFDLTPEMLEKARARCAKAGLANVTFQAGNAERLPFADASFDGAVTRLSIHHFAAPERQIGEIARVLKPGATFILADVVSSDVAEEAALHNALEVLRDPSHVRMLPIAGLRALVENAGFAIASETGWDQTREFEEWAAIVDDPHRVAPIRTVMRRLAETGIHAGFGLARAHGKLVFFHRWHVIVARKRAA